MLAAQAGQLCVPGQARNHRTQNPGSEGRSLRESRRGKISVPKGCALPASGLAEGTARIQGAHRSEMARIISASDTMASGKGSARNAEEYYRAMAEFRHQIRRFLRFSEDAAQAAGAEP